MFKFQKGSGVIKIEDDFETRKTEVFWGSLHTRWRPAELTFPLFLCLAACRSDSFAVAADSCAVARFEIAIAVSNRAESAAAWS